jgi:hypothetical protein
MECVESSPYIPNSFPYPFLKGDVTTEVRHAVTEVPVPIIYLMHALYREDAWGCDNVLVRIHTCHSPELCILKYKAREKIRRSSMGRVFLKQKRTQKILIDGRWRVTLTLKHRIALSTFNTYI